MAKLVRHSEAQIIRDRDRWRFRIYVSRPKGRFDSGKGDYKSRLGALRAMWEANHQLGLRVGSVEYLQSVPQSGDRLEKIDV